uniref:Major Facilitator Superfamily protein n=1 Tax=Candidatus Kentrum sp. SD TaxID=2126332 RepID=A0A450Z4F8_9GAMM|nr:MAG: Major Facilitator Superfamily protein [Candidatus Kentron sp. SD]VFK48652.1 MAG: Major Facilitator Superfamily protein [Candidatus Kentron sp. SD]VFK80512.1 MAG: Major Facilitator Superfamily protein [Candidatus Kentron sp. SD]
MAGNIHEKLENQECAVSSLLHIPKMSKFITIWIASLLSGIGSGITRFVLDLHVYQTTNSITQFTLVATFAVMPGLILSPVVSVFIDRYKKKLPIIILCELASAAIVLLALFLYMKEMLIVWVVYGLVITLSALSSFQFPVLTTLITLFVPEQHYVRMNALLELREAAVKIFSPILASFLVALILMEGVLILDVGTFVVAVLIILLVREPGIAPLRKESTGKKEGFLVQITQGTRFIKNNHGLRGLLIIFAISNITVGMYTILIIPMIPDDFSVFVVGMFLSAGGFGMLSGSLLMSIWGGPSNQITGIFFFRLLGGGSIILTGLFQDTWWTGLAFFGFFAGMAMVGSCNGGLWQKAVPLNMQGRVTALRRLIAWITLPFGYMLAGPIIEIAIAPWLDGMETPFLTNILGSGKKGAINLLYVIAGLMHLAITFIGFSFSSVRNLGKT